MPVTPPMQGKFVLLSLGLLAGTANALTSYANDWIDPGFIVNKGWNSSAEGAQDTIITWAEKSAANGPWSAYPFYSSRHRSLLVFPLSYTPHSPCHSDISDVLATLMTGLPVV